MKLNYLFSLLEKSPLNIKIHNAGDPKLLEQTEIFNLVSDSRKVRAGSVFACVEGDHSDGHDFAYSAFSSGASVLLCEHPLEINVPQIICSDVRRNMGRVASLLYGEPSSKLKMIGITGTNGKTTSAFLTQSILESSGITTGLLGTVWCDDGDIKEVAEHTTPEGPDLQHWLLRMTDKGCSACVMEASSHAISQGRIDGVLYDFAGFTNLTVDHLNYHVDMESYFIAKSRLFHDYMRGERFVAVNIDDPFGARLRGELGSGSVGYSLADRKADFFAEIKNTSVEGTDIDITMPGSLEPVSARLPLLGRYNVMNALQAVSLSWMFGTDKDAVINGLNRIKQVPGRLERYIIEGSGTCVIDFAHNPDGLEKILTALRAVCEGRLTVIFGASGESDRSKRPLMGEAASAIADHVIISSDNPKSEDPLKIAAEIERGVLKHSALCTVVPDREEAVKYGLEMLLPKDILLLAGKGPETTQITKEGPVPYSDKGTLMKWCAKNGRVVR